MKAKQPIKNSIYKFFNFALDKITKLDVLGTQFQLRSRGSTTFKTKVGGVLTIALYILTFYLILKVITNFFDPENVKVSISTQISIKFPQRNLYDLVYPLAVSGLTGADNLPILAQDLLKYVTPMLEIREIDMS
jgi:hypothetical protein